jgi:hypothetical protein
MKLSVFNCGDAGVNLTKSPLHTEDGEWTRLQNAAIELRGSDHGIAKRAGMAVFAGGMVGSVLGLINVPLTPSGDPDDSGMPDGPLGFSFGPAALNIMRTKLYLTAATTAIADNTDTPISWTAEAWDVGNLHDLVTEPTRLTVPTDGDGLYLIIAQAKWATAGNQPKKRTLRILKNAALYAEASVGCDDDGDSLFHQVAAIIPAVATDYFTVSVEQDIGGPADLMGSGEDETWVTAIRLIASTTWTLPRCHANRTTDLTLAVDTPTVVPLDAEAIDTHTMHDLAVNTSRITVPATHAGAYLVTAQYALEAPVPVASNVLVEILKNGTQTLAQTHHAFINSTVQPDTAGTLSGVFVLAVGDYVEIRCTARLAERVLLGDNTVNTLAFTSLSVARIG